MAINYTLHKEGSIIGRYVTLEMLQKHWFDKLPSSTIYDIGRSVNGLPIKALALGNGEKKVLMWSQMHGNESTTTKAVLDLVNFLISDEPLSDAILNNSTLYIIPILNPDGAKSYIRANANNIDLNRDAKLLTQPESQALKTSFADFKPDFCFNLHDQRTLFSAGSVANPATVSFLSPASDVSRKLTPGRETAMQLIVAMNKMLQPLIPNQVGRYDDAFNENCVGDSFQMAGVPTVLFEAGHFQGDYQREKTRELIFHALLEALGTIAGSTFSKQSVEEYFSIPENEKLFFDVLIRNPKAINSKYNSGQHIGIRFKEVMANGIVSFEPEIADVGELEGHYGHETYDCSQQADEKRLSSQKKIYNLVLKQ